MVQKRKTNDTHFVACIGMNKDIALLKHGRKINEEELHLVIKIKQICAESWARKECCCRYGVDIEIVMGGPQWCFMSFKKRQDQRIWKINSEKKRDKWCASFILMVWFRIKSKLLNTTSDMQNCRSFFLSLFVAPFWFSLILCFVCWQSHALNLCSWPHKQQQQHPN